MAIEEKYIEVKGLKWFYREAQPQLSNRNQTEQLPVLLLHGLPAQSYTWTEVMPDLAERGYRAIAPDWIGSGLSAKPDARDFPYTPDAFIDALGSFIAALEIEKFHLVIQGFLASVGVQYALRHPEQIARLAILNAPVTTDARLPWPIQQLGIPLVGEMMTQDPLLVDRTLEKGSGYAISDKDLDLYRRPFLNSSAAGRALFTTVRRLQLKTAMAEIEAGFSSWQHPTLIIWGQADPWLDFSQAQNLAKSIANSQLVPLEGVGHYPQEHWSQKVSDALLPFLRRQEV